MSEFSRVAAVLLIVASIPLSIAAQSRASSADRNLARDILRELIEIDTSEPAGNPGAASDAIAKRLRGAGFAADDVHVHGAEPRLANVVARVRGRDPAAP